MALTARKKQALDQKVRQQMSKMSKQPDSMSITEKFRWSLLSKFGARGFKELASLFQRLDKSGDGKIDEKEFVAGIQSLYLEKFSTKDIKTMFKEIDSDASGCISSKEFNEKMIAEFLPQKRRSEVQKLFKIIDYDKSGFIDKSDLLKKYEFSSNEKFKTGEISKEECIDNFVSCFESENSGQGDGKISLEEFLAYYAGISLAVDEDAYFLLELQKNWKSLNTKSERQRSWPLSDSFALDLSKTSKANIRPSLHQKTDIMPLTTRELTDRRAQTARALKTYRERETSSGCGGTPKPTVVYGNRRSLYRTVAPSYVDRHLFGKPRSQQLMESDWPQFESPFRNRPEKTSGITSQSLDASSAPLKWSPGASFDWTLERDRKFGNAIDEDVDDMKLQEKDSSKTHTTKSRARSSTDLYRTHKVDLNSEASMMIPVIAS